MRLMRMPDVVTPGTVSEDQWGRWGTCLGCGSNYMLNSAGLIYPHDMPLGEGPCPVRWAAASLDAAIARDDALNPQEMRVYAAVFQRLMSCRGPVLDSECPHPICRQRVAKGLRWSFGSWIKTD